jgi:DsbC/DsbD-like thiol-disulfide interchange protein
MTIASRLLHIAVMLVAALASGPAAAGDASPWAKGLHSRVRLIAGGGDGPNRLAGIEIELDRGFKTYWRTPGDSGIPPRFDWSQSRNVRAVEIQWPAPRRTHDSGGVSYGYGGHVVLPVSVLPQDASQPVRLRLALDYGVCKDICIPARAELDLDLAEKGPHSPAIAQALAAVPRPQPLGAEEALSILDAAAAPGNTRTLTVRVRAPAGTMPVLFAEGPEDWSLSTSPVAEDGRVTVTVDDRPVAASGPVSLRLTLAAGDRAVESHVPLDADLRAR